MSRLEHFITEGITEFNERQLDDINTKIHKECKTYLRLIKGKIPLYRGMETRGVDIGLKTVRKNRKPTGMGEDEARALNKMLQKKGHARRDGSILVTSNKDHTYLFGSPYYVFPKDKMKYTWIETADINISDDRVGWHQQTIDAWIQIILLKGELLTPVRDRLYQGILDDLQKPFEDYFHTNKGFNTAYDNEYEIWIETDSYYFADANLYHWYNNKQELFL